MPVIRQAFITRADMRANPTRLYLFGDNEARNGSGGQAKEMRGEPNVIGIRTKRAPGWDESAYWSDEQFESNKQMLKDDFMPVVQRMVLEPGLIVVIPKDGLGTGMAQLQTRAPRTLELIEMWISLLETLGSIFESDELDVDGPRSGHGSPAQG